MDDLYMMGFDVWGEGLAEPDYLDLCKKSPKYQKGQWHVLVVENQIVSSLITYENQFGLPQRCYGIGSVASSPEHRKMGYASALVNEVVKNLENAGGQSIYLFSDIGASFYEKLGFETLDNANTNSSSLCMVRVIDKTSPLPQEVPSYF